MAKVYTVFVDDNFHYMDESERYKLGEFADCASAVAACKQIVDEFLTTHGPKNSATELYHQYVTFGEDPWISSEDSECKFSAWNYARERAKVLVKK
ncbi:MAG TPA: hypothetical protein VHQ22_09335 [Terriglobales bacterium]|jgi:hypothetical protein|nr:hypothetical protein [Terriglobales bacterium]